MSQRFLNSTVHYIHQSRTLRFPLQYQHGIIWY
ncbi:rCG53324 [Rattus norvegicus]|uniref:RCG53324 n=1 Tax=Rattus norvegicus TaxID=10116 RepID=A6JMU5_RAT|nr:rCG53324 [Rattus norvegicus]